MTTAVGEVLRAQRAVARLTQEDLALRAGLSVRTIRGLETGRVRNPQRATIELLAAALHLGSRDRAELASAARTASWEARTGLPGPTAVDQVVAALIGVPAGLALVAVAGPGAGAVAGTAAEHAAPAFPDGRLQAALGGRTTPTDPAQVLAGFLQALGRRVAPRDPEERRGLFRTLVADRRVLLVLTDATAETQIRPLLPGGPGSAVLVTSDRWLLGLEGARHIAVPDRRVAVG